MKKRIAFCLLLMCGMVQNANGMPLNGIDLLSSEYHIWGNVALNLTYGDSSGQTTATEFLYRSYDVHSVIPVTRSVTGDYAFTNASSAAGEFFIDVTDQAHGIPLPPTPDGGSVIVSL